MKYMKMGDFVSERAILVSCVGKSSDRVGQHCSRVFVTSKTDVLYGWRLCPASAAVRQLAVLFSHVDNLSTFLLNRQPIDSFRHIAVNSTSDID